MNIFKKIFGLKNRQSSSEDELITYAKTVVFYAKEAAQHLTATYVEPEHLLLGILAYEGSRAEDILQLFKLRYTSVFEFLQNNETSNSLSIESIDIGLSSNSITIIQSFTNQINQEGCDSSILIQCLLDNPSPKLNEIWTSFGIDTAKLNDTIEYNLQQLHKIRRFTYLARQVMNQAQKIAEEHNQQIIDCGHFLTALYTTPGIAHQALKEIGLNKDMIVPYLEKTHLDIVTIDLSESVKRVLEQSVDRTRRANRNFIRTDDFLFGLLISDNRGLSILNSLSVDIPRLTELLREIDQNHPISILETFMFSWRFSYIYTELLEDLAQAEVPYLEPEHLILAFFETGLDCRAGRILHDLNVTSEKLNKEITQSSEKSEILRFSKNFLRVLSTVSKDQKLTTADFLITSLNTHSYLFEKLGISEAELQSLLAKETEAITSIELP